MNQLILGDCLEKMKDIPDNSIDMVFTDIPYNNVNRKTNGLRQIDKGIADSSIIDIPKLINELKRVCKGSIYIFCEFNQVSLIRSLLQNLSTRVIVWEKTNPSPMNGKSIWLSGIELCVFAKFPKAIFNGHCRNTVLKYKTVRSKIHPTEKPQDLLVDIIKTSSNENDVILDCCAGSGSTAIACLNMNRKFICIEKDEKFFEIMKDRIAKHRVNQSIGTDLEEKN